MKILIGTLVFIFLVFFNSIELSTQADNSPPRENNNFLYEPDVHSYSVMSRPEGIPYLLPNGNSYLSRGTGPITVFYSPSRKLAMVFQEGGPEVTIGPPSLQEQLRKKGKIRMPDLFKNMNEASPSESPKRMRPSRD